MTSKTKTMGAVAGSMLLLGSSALGFAATHAEPAVADTATLGAEVVSRDAQLMGDKALVPIVQGQFSYDQAVVSPTHDISSVFVKAAASLCASLPNYELPAIEQAIRVSAARGPVLEATVSDMKDADGAQSYTMACACASNLPGGGAIGNADVEGVSLESIAAMMGA